MRISFIFNLKINVLTSKHVASMLSGHPVVRLQIFKCYNCILTGSKNLTFYNFVKKTFFCHLTSKLNN